jgi:hypothetical protein
MGDRIREDRRRPSFCARCLDGCFFLKLAVTVTFSVAVTITTMYTFNLQFIYNAAPGQPAAASKPCCEPRCAEPCERPPPRDRPSQRAEYRRADYKVYIVEEAYPSPGYYPLPRRIRRLPPPPCDPCWDYGWDEDADE